MQLNQQQLEAVHSISQPLLVLAGAGSGKTRVITEKIRYLVRECSYPSKNVYAVTFTNKAAKEMQERVKGTLTREETNGLKVTTFHRLGLQILKKHGHLCGLRKGFSIYDQRDSLSLLADLLGDSDEAKLIQMQISNWKNDHQSVENLQGCIEDELMQNSVQAYADYREQLLTYNALDFDDLIFMPLQLLSTNGEVLKYWQREIRYLLVDEYQDTNLCQYELVKLLMAHKNGLTVVGDDDQSIYAWRGARPENLHKLHEDFPNLKMIKLEQNYRSTGHILNAANQVIRFNPHLYEKSLWSSLGMGDEITVDEFKSAQDEIDFVVLSIEESAALVGNDYSQFAILYRGNHQAKVYEIALNMRNIPVRVVGGTSFFQQPEIKDLISYLKVIANSEDIASLLRIINVPKREIGVASLKKLVEFSKVNQLSLYDALKHDQLGAVLGKSLGAKCRDFYRILFQTKAQLDLGETREALESLLDRIGYDDYLREQSISPKSLERKQKNIEYLVNWLDQYDMPFEEILSHLTLISILENDSEQKDHNAVTLMTLHSAKGLEFPYVFLVSMEEDILPHKNSIDNDTVEEERRLFYVGITRARQKLALTYCRQRKRYGEWESCTPSRFLDELPEENIIWRRPGETSSKELKEQVSSMFSDLQAMLKS
ncbi:UvrD-helicase domain-containing protein [Wohlfahrtiimonas populi]|uniref:UvrD-helicase domain-containing protein n=1 Tax=Wohlfahrtiimonas populi TaxID=1940240 RepID=UPI00098D6A78|nr:UvrD-helicase domain-containing protein [Wohlfahrtiimonas populi]